jgi:hypothetical protein
MTAAITDLTRKLKAARSTIRRMKRVSKHMERAMKFTAGGKGLDLHWLGRRNVNDVLDGGSPCASRPSVVKILNKWPREANIIKNGGFESNWESGFWSGVCATGRLFGELSSAADDRAIEHAWDEFPMLDS